MPFVQGDRVRLQRSHRLGTVLWVRMSGYQIHMDDHDEVEFWSEGEVLATDERSRMESDTVCPLDGAQAMLLTTTSEYRYQCIKCGARFNDQGEVQPTWDDDWDEGHPETE